MRQERSSGCTCTYPEYPRMRSNSKTLRPSVLSRFSSSFITKSQQAQQDQHADPSIPKSAVVVSVSKNDLFMDDSSTMSYESQPSTRPGSSHRTPPKLRRQVSHFQRPTLAEILTNRAPYPWTLENFRAYSEKNYALENLQFIEDAERYRHDFERLTDTVPGNLSEERPALKRISSAALEVLHDKWKELIILYIVPSSPRELNLPGKIRNDLVDVHKSGLPPAPEFLQPAIKKTYELIEESILFSFLNEVRQPESDSDSQDADVIEHTVSAPKRMENKAATKSSLSNLSAIQKPHTTSPKSSHFNLFHHHQRPESTMLRSTNSGSVASSTLASLDTAVSSSSMRSNSPSQPQSNAKSPPLTPNKVEFESPKVVPRIPRANKDNKDDKWKRMSARLFRRKSESKSRPKDDDGDSYSDPDIPPMPGA